MASTLSDEFNRQWPVSPEPRLEMVTLIVEQNVPWCRHVLNASRLGCPDLARLKLQILSADLFVTSVAVSLPPSVFGQFCKTYERYEGRMRMETIIGWQLRDWASAHLTSLGVPLPAWAV